MHSKKSKCWWIVPAGLAAAVLALWLFPKLWFTAHVAHTRISLVENHQIDGWTFEEIPINEAAERALVADRIVNGEFRSPESAPIRVFSARRNTDHPNEIGLFVHTPDRCWVEGGWRMEPAPRDFVEVNLQGSEIKLERRIFHYGNSKELVYFGGLIDGQALPYRLDHNLSIAARGALKDASAATGGVPPASRFHFWRRLWTSFTTRTKLAGPKQFFRISTPFDSEDVEGADRRLSAFLQKWLVSADPLLAMNAAQKR